MEQLPHSQLNNLSSVPETQCSQLLRLLKEKNGSNTLEIRERGIMHPAGAVKKLRQEGHNIFTHMRAAIDALGKSRNVAHYFLLPGKFNGRKRLC